MLLAWPAVMKVALLLVAVGACSPVQTQVRMPNPALTNDHVEARQSYEVGPFKSDHRYELTLEKWTPQEVDFAIHLVNVGDCGDSLSYVFTLVDDQGKTYPMRELTSAATRLSGHAGAALRETKLECAFPASIGPSTKSVVVQIRPRGDVSCSSLDFKWIFE
jgi:hypothetical protein